MTTKYTDADRKKRLDEIAVKMKTAKGAELDALVAEVDKVIEFSEGRYDKERDGSWELTHGGRNVE